MHSYLKLDLAPNHYEFVLARRRQAAAAVPGVFRVFAKAEGRTERWRARLRAAQHMYTEYYL